MSSDVVLSIDDLSIVYHTPRGDVRATSNVSFQVQRGETIALIGESGSGKTTLSLSLIRMLPNNAAITSGQILYTRDGQTRNVLHLSNNEIRSFRWRDCAMVFQGAQNAFNPVLRIRQQFADTAAAHGERDRAWVKQRTLELFKLVRLDPQRVYESYPHELSGGMKQRALLALGVLLDPQVVILDEPTTALDILTQRAIIDVLKEMQQRLNFSIIFISHDLALAAEMADRVATMYAGEIVELAGVNDIFYRPQHPYTLGLLKSVPKLDRGHDELISIPGDPPNLITPPSGCKFHPRCQFADARCETEAPPLAEVTPGQWAACWHSDKVGAQMRAEAAGSERTHG
ncbi:MAG: ABC transporter ATP-binding protein [Chloroflexi bacterium]|nr:ABC transporter ATP-binding protein [Chloroflexota bacterium]